MEIGEGVRGGDAEGRLGRNRDVAGARKGQTSRALIEGGRPGTYRLRVVFSDSNGTVPPDGVYWDITVLSATPAPTAVPAAQAAATTAIARADQATQAPAGQGTSSNDSGGSSMGGVLLFGGIAAIIGWVLYRRRRSNL